MRLGYKLRRLLGSVHANGNLVFHPDGNSILSAVRNRVAWIDLVNQTSSVLPPQTRSDIAVLACSNDGKLLVAVDVQGRAMLISLARRLALHRIAFKRPVTALAFSPDDGLLAVAVGKVVEVWRTRSLRQHITFNLSLVRSYGGQSQDITCLEWAPDGRHFIAGCRDMTARIYYANLTGEETGFIPSTLAGHRDELVGAFWGSEDTCYTVARDGGVFWWEFELAAGSTKTGLYCPSQGRWKLAQKQFVRPSTHGSSVASASLQRERGLLVLGFSNGVFGLYEMPDASPIHTLSVGQEGLSASAINSTGEWLAFGCAKFGQMLVWEWQSESYVIKQQGHNYGLNCLAFSPNGALLATGGEDNKVKLWNAGSGFSFVTFAEHEAPVTAVAFTSNGSAVLSASLDGTVRAHDLIRYKNFRTLATPSPAQLSCLAVDPAGEIVAAGSIEPFEIYVWSLQTGKVLDVFSGHEAPVSSLDFSPTDGMLASASWDGTVKIWAIYKHELVETFEMPADVLAVAYRPDGQQVCAACLNGTLQLWNVEEGELVGIIEGKGDIQGGKRKDDFAASISKRRSGHFTTVAFSADGTCVIAGGESPFVCIYSCANKLLVKRFQTSLNRSLDGVLSDPSVLAAEQSVAGAASAYELEMDERANTLPGAKRGGAGSRSTREAARTTCVRFSSTGTEWAAAVTEGLLLYSLDEDLSFAPLDIDEDVTPATVMSTLSRREWAKGVMMALRLSEAGTVRRSLEAVPAEELPLVARAISPHLCEPLLRGLADRLASGKRIEFYLRWVCAVLQGHGQHIRVKAATDMKLQAALMGLQKASSKHEQELVKLLSENQYILQLLAGV